MKTIRNAEGTAAAHPPSLFELLGYAAMVLDDPAQLTIAERHLVAMALKQLSVLNAAQLKKAEG